MAKGDVNLKMDFTFGNAAGARHIVNEVWKTQQADLKRVNQQANMLGMSMRKLGRSVAYGVAGFVGVQGVNAVFSSLVQGADEFVSKRSELEKAITPLTSLGDNVNNLQNIRKEVVQTAISLGTTTDTVAGFLFDLQSNTGNVSDAIRGELKKEILELAEVTGGDLVTAQNLMTKAYQISGKEVKNLNELQNKLMYTQEQAALRFEDLATRAPEVLAAGQVVGVGFNEVMASIIGATKKSGSIEKTFTGMRNVFLLMEEAQKKGITLTGSYIDKLAQLRDQFSTNNEKMRKLFGQESVVAAKVLADSVDDVSASLEKLKGITGNTDTALEKLRAKFQDPGYFFSRDMQAIARTIEEAPNIAPDTAADSAIVRAHRRGKLGSANVAASTAGQFGALGKVSGYIGGLFSQDIAEGGRDIVASQTEGELFKAQMRQKFEEKKAADMRKIRLRQALLFSPFFMYADPARLERDRLEVENRQMQPFLMSPEDRTAYNERIGFSPGGQRNAEGNQQASTDPKMMDVLGQIEKNTRPSQNPNAMGGSRANAQEVL